MFHSCNMLLVDTTDFLVHWKLGTSTLSKLSYILNLHHISNFFPCFLIFLSNGTSYTILLLRLFSQAIAFLELPTHSFFLTLILKLVISLTEMQLQDELANLFSSPNCCADFQHSCLSLVNVFFFPFMSEVTQNKKMIRQPNPCPIAPSSFPIKSIMCP